MGTTEHCATHTDNFHMWHLGQYATKGLQSFAEDGLTSHLTDELSQNSAISSIFGANALSEGTGTASSVLAMHSTSTKVRRDRLIHTIKRVMNALKMVEVLGKTVTLPQDQLSYGPMFETKNVLKKYDFFQISIVIKIIPSPDWFVGVDGISLHDGLKWVKAASFELYPIDAGTDKGLTFTSPNFAESPAKSISRIYWNRPSHPAASFQYPGGGLPSLGRLTFTQISTNEFQRLTTGQKYILNSIVKTDKWNDLSKENSKIDLTKLAGILGEKKLTVLADQPQDLPTDCRVSSWGDWKCDRQRCGVGILKRYRYIRVAPKYGGKICPVLVEMKPYSLHGLNSKRRNCIKRKLEKETRKFTKQQRKRVGYKFKSVKNI
ncbi:spondin-2-like [Antedon mediterranea]|uniref:spondin-2-like n=1 Tax=Antedon mediterranea TaxID=105859 RepID=UPI003AF9048D